MLIVKYIINNIKRYKPKSLKRFGFFYCLFFVKCRIKNSGVAQLIERGIWDAQVAGLNPVTATKETVTNS
jgi:intracellular septation protein A